MGKYRAVIIGAGRIGAGWNWHDLTYTHAGAYHALRDRVELVGFVEPDKERGVAAALEWSLPTFRTIEEGFRFTKPDIVSICTQPEQQREVLFSFSKMNHPQAIWCEKPFVGPAPAGFPYPIQVNYMRRADSTHQHIADYRNGGTLVVYAKDDIHTRCHFEDLSKWWKCSLDYRVFNGPCAYIYQATEEYQRHDNSNGLEFFDNGGINPGDCMKRMLANLLDHIEGKAELWSPPR